MSSGEERWIRSRRSVPVADRVWEDWRAQSAESSKPWIALLFASDLEAGVARRKLAAAVGRVVSEFEHGQDNLPAGVEEVAAGAWSLAEVPEGVLLTVGEKCDAFELLLNRVADELERDGVAGSFDLYQLANVPRPPKLTDLLEARLRVNGERVRRGYHYAWSADPDALARVARAAMPWCLANPAGSVTLQVRTLPPLPVTSAELEARLRDGIENAADLGVVSLRSIVSDGFRTLAVEPSTGRVTLVDGGSPIYRAWTESVRDLIRIIRATSRDLVYAFVKRGSLTYEAEAGASLERDWPEPRSAGSRRGDAFEDVAVPDAFGIQMLGPDVAERVAARGEWRVTRLDGDRVLVEHQDLDAWLRGPRLEDALKGLTSPPAELLTRARADLASILFREDQFPR